MVFPTFARAARSVYPSTARGCSFFASSYTNAPICWQAAMGGTRTGSVPSRTAPTSVTSPVICSGSATNTTTTGRSPGFTLLRGVKITYFSAISVIGRSAVMNRFAFSVFLCRRSPCMNLARSRSGICCTVAQ